MDPFRAWPTSASRTGWRSRRTGAPCTSATPHEQRGGDGHTIHAYPVIDDRTLGEPRVFAEIQPGVPDDGRTVDHERLGRSIWTVSWTAVRNKPDIYIRNERQVNILETEHFGRLGFVEFGALTVGRIVQRHLLGQPFERGAQKSVFKFGGSAVAIFGEPGAWRPADDILRHTPEGMETIVRLGEPVAMSRKAR